MAVDALRAPGPGEQHSERRFVSVNNADTLVVSGESVQRYLLRSVHRLEAAVLQRLTAELPVYRKLPTEQLSGDVARMIRRGIGDFA
jgi:ribosomal protein L13